MQHAMAGLKACAEEGASLLFVLWGRISQCESIHGNDEIH
jgi:hypothetical protein